VVAAVLVQRFSPQNKESEANLVRPESMPELTAAGLRP
jgi:hypothetical protein